MSKLSIRAKVIAVIAFMLIAMSGMGLLAVRSMQVINAHTVEIASNWLPSVRVLGDLRTDINLFRIALRAHVMANTLEGKAGVDKRLAGILDRIAKDRTAYEPLLSTAEERAMYENWSRAWDRYVKGIDTVIDLSRKSVGKIPVEASEAISKTVAVVAAESDALLEKSINYNNAGADTATRQAAEGYNFAFWTVLGIIVAVMICGFAVGLYLVRDLSNGIASIVKPMQALGSGDLSAEVGRRGEKTEIGVMADALQVFKDALIAKKAADEAAAVDAEAKIERGRRVDSITRDFEALIGEIVD
ncbi:MAG: MCP four helix bundle domain-containing protein, partial [bacterium]|nr:MCP four helix bundle domain-containing protein [bacterium]